MKRIELLRGVTLADRALWNPEIDAHPPTFAPGDVVEVADRLASELVGNGKARFVTKEIEAATAAPVETASVSAKVRKAAQEK